MTQGLMILYCLHIEHSRNIFHSINIRKKFFELKERHDTMNIESPNKNFLTNNLIVDIFVFTAAIIFGYSYNNNTIFAVQTQ